MSESLSVTRGGGGSLPSIVAKIKEGAISLPADVGLKLQIGWEV